MKRTITLRFLLSLCVLTLCSFLDRGGNIACAEEVTYENIVNDFPIKAVNGSYLMDSMDPQTYTSSNGLFNITFSWGESTATSFPQVYTTDFRLEKNQEVTVSMADGKSLIKKIVFTFAKNSFNYSDKDSYASGTWEATAPTSSVTFKRTGGYVRVKGMTITYEPASVATKKDVTVKMSDAATIDLLDTYQASAEVFTTDDDTKVEGAKIIYSIEPASGDFSFDEETGLFTAGKTEGTYTIKASFKGDDDHNMADASTTVTVNSRVWALKNYVQVTDESQVIDGAQYLLVYDDGVDLNVMSTYNSSLCEANNARLTYADYKDGNLMRVHAEYAGAPFVLEAVGDNKYALKNSQGYLECWYDRLTNTTSYGLMISETSDIAAAQWTITIADGKAHIVNVQDPALELCYYSPWNSFLARSYTGNALTLYAKCADMNFNKLANGYATYAIGSAYQMPAGVTGYAIKGWNESDHTKLVKEEAFIAGSLVPALTPLLVYAENLEGEDKTYYPILLQKEVGDYTGDNYLEYKRTAENMTDSKKSVPVYYYKLTMRVDSENPENSKPLGFYWGAADGAAFKLNKSSSAYLALPKSLFARGLASALLFDEEGQATDIQLTPTTENNTQAIYNLQGVRVSGKLAKGIYIVNGKKVYVK